MVEHPSDKGKVEGSIPSARTKDTKVLPCGRILCFGARRSDVARARATARPGRENPFATAKELFLTIAFYVDKSALWLKSLIYIYY